MNFKIAPLSLALASSLLATPVFAGDMLHWQNNSLTYLYGKDYKIDSPIQQTLTFEHASGWAWGDMFLFVDNIFYNGESGSDGHTYYGEFSPRLSLGKISGHDMSFGPIKDVLLAATYERGESQDDGTPNRNYLLGPAVDLDVPGFDRLAINVYYRKPDGTTGKPSGQWQITPTWAMTFPVGKSDILFDGFIDWVVNDKSNANTELKRNLHINPQIKYDLGKAMDMTPGKLYVGIEYDYWSNKYAIEDGGFVSENFVGKTDQNTMSLLVKAHF